MLECDLKISEDYDYDTQKHIICPPMCEFKGIFDTGATNSVISVNVVDKLGLKSVGREKVYHVGGVSYENVYLINVILPNNMIFVSLSVTEGMFSGFDVLIGMDVISKGDFAVTTSEGKTVFSFQVPSTNKIIF